MDELMQNPVLEFDVSEKDNNSEISITETKDIKENEQSEIDLREKVKEAEYDDISYRQWQYSNEQEDISFEQFISKDETLEDYLLTQLTFSKLKGRCAKIGRFLIEAIDDNGYLTLDLETVAKAFEVDVNEVIKVLDVIQTFEPYGVGARTIEECLIIQLAQKGLLEDGIEYIILHHLADIGDNRLQKVAKETGMTLVQVQMVCDLIKSLEPKPGRQFSNGEPPKYIVPDILVENIEGELVVLSNDSTSPRLMVSSYYLSLNKRAEDDLELKNYLSEKYNSAIWLIKSIEQRKQTIYNVANSIVEHQKDFFSKGPKYLKTLTLRDIADDLGIHESTVSRSINGKYMQSPMGVFELKYFFSSGVQGASGDNLSSNSIKTFIKEIIASEDPKKPYSDQDMVEILEEKGIQISRRTVAKYREALNILSSSKRRRF